MIAHGVDLTVSTLREAKYIEARIQRYKGQNDWWSSRLPVDEKQAVDECKKMIHKEAYEADQQGKKFLNDLHSQMREDLLPEAAFDWIKKGGERAIRFVANALCDQIKMGFYYDGQGINFVYFLMDVLKLFSSISTRQSKLDQLGSICKHWQKLEKHKWLDSMSEDHFRWAAKYLQERSIMRGGVFPPAPDPENADIQLVQGYVWDSFCFSRISGADLREFIRAMKGALASKKNREKGKTLNCQISEERFKQLDVLAEHHDCSKTKMIERLIKWEYQKVSS